MNLPRNSAPSTRTGRKNSRAARADKASPVHRQPASRDDAVQVRVLGQPLVPGVQHGQNADAGSEVAGVGGEFQHASLAQRNSRSYSTC